MGLYNMVFGITPQAPLVLALLNRGPGDFGRIRDAWIEKHDGDVLRLVVYTRNGGGNRNHYGVNDENDQAGETCKCTGCTMRFAIPKHPLYLTDADDAFDRTYAKIYYRMPDVIPDSLVEQLPEELKASDQLLSKLLEIASDPIDTSQRWLKAIDSIRAPAKSDE